VITDLFAVTSGLDVERRLLTAIPPACRRPVDRPPRPIEEDGAAVLEFPPWRPRRAASHFLPSLSLLSSAEWSVRFELSVEHRGDWCAWTASASIGPARFAALEASRAQLRSDVDVFVASEPADRVRLRLRVHLDDLDRLASCPWLATLSACDPSAMESAAVVRRVHRAVSVAIPAHSQMEEPEAIRHRICSPTSVAMVLGRWGVSVEPSALAARVFHDGLDLYGVWPAAIRAASQHGVAGYLLRFPDWDTAAWCLAEGLPIVASVRFARGELTGAALEETSGHLIVLTGLAGDDVLVNDPAAPTRETVARRYRREELERVWLERSGVGYVFFAAGDR
jgi:peptidase C39-like protein